MTVIRPKIIAVRCTAFIPLKPIGRPPAYIVNAADVFLVPSNGERKLEKSVCEIIDKVLLTNPESTKLVLLNYLAKTPETH